MAYTTTVASPSRSHKMDSCALGTDGKLLGATDLEWFNDPDDTHPLPHASSTMLRYVN